MVDSGIYVGTLRHRRWQVKKHEFTYPIFLALLDVDQLPELMKVSPFASYNQSNLVSYQERDHFGDVLMPLRERLVADAAAKDVCAPGGRIMMLTHLRLFGYNFNPVSFFYCYGANGRVDSVVAEVNNTFGETHNYWLTAKQQVPSDVSKRYRFSKDFHVSPFYSLDQQYDWTFTEPGDRLIVESMNFEKNELVFDSTLKLERREWTRRELHRVLAEYPLMTMKVVAAIHWEAVRLMLKGVKAFEHPGKGKYAVRNTKNLGASWKTH